MAAFKVLVGRIPFYEDKSMRREMLRRWPLQRQVEYKCRWEDWMKRNGMPKSGGGSESESGSGFKMIEMASACVVVRCVKAGLATV